MTDDCLISSLTCDSVGFLAVTSHKRCWSAPSVLLKTRTSCKTETPQENVTLSLG